MSTRKKKKAKKKAARKPTKTARKPRKKAARKPTKKARKPRKKAARRSRARTQSKKARTRVARAAPRRSSAPPAPVTKPQLPQREPVAALAFSRDGSRLAVSLVRSPGGKEAGHVVVYDVSGVLPRLVSEVSLLGGGVEILALSPNGSFVAAGRRRENGVELVDANNGKLAHTLIVRGATALAFAPDGQRLAVGSYNADEAASRVVVLDAKGGAELFRSEPLRQPLIALSFLDDGLVLSGVLDHWGAVVAWDIDAGRELFRLPEFDDAPARRGRAAAASADGLAVATCDGTHVDVWSLEGHRRASLDVGCVPSSIALNRDGSILFVGSPNPAAWSVGSGARLATLDGPGLVAVHPDNERVLICSSIDPRRGPELFSIRDALAPTGTLE